MRQSYYNVMSPLDDGFVALYNTRSRGCAILDVDEAQRLDDPDLPRDAGLVDALAHEGFLVEDPEREADFMLYRQRSHRNNSCAFDITISPSRECNFSCDYCYVDKRPGRMGEATQERLVKFIEDQYDRAPFKKLKVNWYGGEPLLALDIIENLSARLMELCSEKGAGYVGHVLTNGSLATPERCRRLVACGVKTIMPTISGNGDMHDYQRRANDGAMHFRDLMSNIDHMLEAGLTVHANFVVNHNNFEECKELASKLCRKPGVVPRVTRTFAYGREGMVLKDGKGTPLRLFGREEFSPYYLDFYRALGLDARGYADAMKPVDLYCAAWSNRGFFVDEVGDVFACMVDMDYPKRALTNVSEVGKPNAPFNWARFCQFDCLEPLRDPECRACAVLPICQGGCACCRMLGDDVCHDLKDCIGGFVHDYAMALTTDERM